MKEVLELTDKKCKATIIKMLQRPIASEKKKNEDTTWCVSYGILLIR